MAELTVIITLLNEGIEVKNTLRSLRESTKESFDIILIDDGSTDNFDYKQVADTFNAVYIKHSKRQGVAFSRDEAVALCVTKYFLLLDAHMRIFQKNWLSRIIEELEKDEYALLCGATFALDINGEQSKVKNVVYGAYLDLKNLDANWIYGFKKEKIQNTIEIPCIMGASYACNKKYWLYLKGLKGLALYGFDEQFISIKVWLSGGKCKVLSDVEFGHIFHDLHQTSYKNDHIEFNVNRLRLVELFFKKKNKIDFIKYLRSMYDVECVNMLIEQLSKCKQDVLEEKMYYENIFQRNFDFIVELNNSDLYLNRDDYYRLNSNIG